MDNRKETRPARALRGEGRRPNAEQRAEDRAFAEGQQAAKEAFATLRTELSRDKQKRK